MGLSSSSTLLLLLCVSIGGLIHLPSASVVNMFSPIRCLFLSSNLFKSLQIHLQKKKTKKKIITISLFNVSAGQSFSLFFKSHRLLTHFFIIIIIIIILIGSLVANVLV